MGLNGYFEMENKDGKTWLVVHLPNEGGEMFDSDEVINYLTMISFPDYDRVELDKYIKAQKFDEPLMLLNKQILPERERCMVTISKNEDKAFARFYPPSAGGNSLTEDDIVSDLQFAGIRHGIKRKAIQHFIENHEYCRDYIIAEATQPVQGSDAKIEYFFDTNVTARPKLNEDGSVDFHQLGNIRAVQAGEKLATLTPVDRGKKGISVLGHPILPKKVRNLILRYGRNIALSKDKCTIFSNVSGHVTLVEGMVMVSDIYEVPANVDSATGDIDYNGTVHVAGNVTTGFAVKAEGDIVVDGVVEGAVLEAGGNIVIKRGVQGMDRAEITASGNVTAKFLENCKVKCDGALKADAVLHSTVDCIESIDVLGKKGLINGGKVRTYATISATSLGSTMGAATHVEVLPDKELQLRIIELEEREEEIKTELSKMDQVIAGIKKLLAEGGEVSPEQDKYVRNAVTRKPSLQNELKEVQYEKDMLSERVERNKNACIKVERDVFPGVKIMVKDVMKIQKEKTSHARFVRDGADIRIRGL